MQKRLKQLEEGSRTSAASDLDRSVAVQSLIDDCVKRNSEMLFGLWRAEQLAAGLTAERQDYEDEKAAEKAANEIAWQAHLASLPPNERGEIQKRGELNQICARLTFEGSSRRFTGARREAASQQPHKLGGKKLLRTCRSVMSPGASGLKGR
jgi:lipase chaperone LimK